MYAPACSVDGIDRERPPPPGPGCARARPTSAADIRWNTAHWPHEIAAHRYSWAAGAMRGRASLATRPFERFSSASSRRDRLLGRCAWPRRRARTRASRSIGPQKPPRKKTARIRRSARLAGARVEGERAPVLGERALDLERQGALPVGSLAPPRVVGVAGRDRLGRRGRVGRRGRSPPRAPERAVDARPPPAARARSGERQACRTHFTSSGNVGFFPYIRMPTR